MVMEIMRLTHIGVSRISYCTLEKHIRFHGVRFTGKFGPTYTYLNATSALDISKYRSLTPVTYRKMETINSHLLQNVVINQVLVIEPLAEVFLSLDLPHDDINNMSSILHGINCIVCNYFRHQLGSSLEKVWFCRLFFF